ncbi:MAG: xanthine dehydrogenase family protein molybdopterin-binding subunit, partial [Acidimicrobiales bacterium]
THPSPIRREFAGGRAGGAVSVGAATVRVDARGKVTGEAMYPGDLCPPRALHAKIVFTDQPHARLRSLDVDGARPADGVVAVFTAADVPVNEYGLVVFDQPVFVPVGGVSRWEADHLAVVVAETPEAAAAGASLVLPGWEPLPIVDDLDVALAGERLVHPEAGSNVSCSYRIRKGDPDAGWAAADVIVDGIYTVPYQEHAYLQPEAGLAYVDDEGRVTVVVAGQWAHEDREQIAHALDLPVDDVRVVYPAIGGAFGGREDMSVQIVLALAAQRLGRPVFTQWSREESIVGHHKRHRGRIHARWGATADGRITVVEADCYLDAGAYNYTSNKVLANLHLTVAGPYEVPHARIDSHAVCTNNVPGGAFRGFGAPQGAFVAETQMSKLADRLGVDPVELRRRNCFREESLGITQTPLPPGVTIGAVIDACASRSRWGEAVPEPGARSPIATLPPATESVRHGRGFACGFKNVGFSYGFPERCEATIVLDGSPDDESPHSAELFHAGAEVGQGAHTAFLQMAAEATGVPLERVRGQFSDTATSGDSGSASASRLTFMAGNAILGAAEEAEKRWREGDRPAVGTFRFTPRPTEPLDPVTGLADGNITFGYVAQAVDVSVDVETGHVPVHRVTNASDVGRAINPDLVRGQVQGAVAQAHGYAVTEHLQLSGGRILNPRLSIYLIPGIGDVPDELDTVVLELADPQGPWGARGVAEMPMIPLAAAIAAALHDATGVWIDAFPFTPDRVLAALDRARGR